MSPPRRRPTTPAPRRTKSAAGKPARTTPRSAASKASVEASRKTVKPSGGAPASAAAPSPARDKLAVYRSKRNFARTPEPSGGARATRRSLPRFVIQKHAATAMHYDVRLEIDGVLKSWAVPKGPSMNPRDKRLAVETEDHPLDYAGFEGIIPEDEYGGGTVIVWDRGTYRNLKRRDGRDVPMAECHRDGRIEVWLDGEKVRGGFALVHGRLGGNRRAWLLVKMKDDEAVTATDPLRRKVRSVLSGRTIEEVARHPDRRWTSP